MVARFESAHTSNIPHIFRVLAPTYAVEISDVAYNNASFLDTAMAPGGNDISGDVASGKDQFTAWQNK